MMTITSIQPKLVIAKNLDAFNDFLDKYDFDEEDFIFVGTTSDDLLSLGGIMKQTYGIVLTGKYKENPMYLELNKLIQDDYFSIVQIMP